VDAPLACAGVPRDLGVAQGSAFGHEVRARAGTARLLEGLSRPAPELARLDRDLWRHHPQLAERVTGLALAAGASRRGVLRALARAGGAPSEAVALVAASDTAPPRIWCRFAAGSDPDTPRVRFDRPDAGIPALVAAPAWLPAAVCGVNQAGLAVAVSAPEAPPGGADRFHVPPLVLVGDCLQRFSDVAGVLRWCAGRPAGGVATVLAADAAGDVAGLGFAPGQRTPLSLEDGVLMGSGPRGLCRVLAKASRQPAGAGAEAWAAALRDAVPGAAGVWLDPARRRLGVSRADGSAAHFDLPGS
jgi:hypothetical protein